MIDDGVIPNIAALHDRSAVSSLESQLPPWTPSAWPSMYTGVNPGKHGVYDFLHFDGYDWDVVNRSYVKEHAVWELLSMEGYSSVVVNVPVTNPPRAFDGVLVPGYTAPEEADCHPEGTWDELERELGEYRLYNESLGSGASEEERKRGYGELTRMRGAAFRYLVDEHDPDFGFIQFQQCDTVYHEFPEERETIRRVYSAIDEEVGDIVEACDPDVTLIASDHGIGPIEGYEFRVNNYLRDEGFVNVTAEGGGMPSWKSISRKRLQRGEESGPVERSTAERALELAARVGITSQRLGAVVTRLGLEDVVLKVVPQDVIRAGTEQVDFGSSTAYMRSRTEMGVRLNVDGREPEGTVPESEYEQVRDAVIDSLEGVESPDGAPVFERVCPREEVFEGPYVEDAPDVVTVPSRFDHFLVANLKEARFGDPTEPWEHKLEGVVMASGEGIDPGADLAGPHLFDLTPTILATFGLPAGERMDGTPLPVVEPTGTTEYPTFDPEDAVTTDDTDVEQRLADLGYLE
jgi:predicted AlkP superfamily phosphohydrolase/phosphomutase